MAIVFKSEPIKVTVLDSGGKPVQHKIERRFDPLTSQSSLICHDLKDKWTGYYSTRDEQWLSDLVEKSKSGCPFCPQMIDKVVSKFPEAQVKGGVLKLKDVYVFPNLFPRTEFEAVVTSPQVHYLNLSQFSPDLLRNFLTAATECIRVAYNSNNALAYAVVGTNYLPPAGASLIHFHQQIAMQGVPFTRIKSWIEPGAKYAKVNKSNFWEDLIAANKEREIKQMGNVYWYTPFAPIGFSEVRALANKSNFLEFEEGHIRNIAAGLSNVLRYYGDQGFDSFNCVIYSGALGMSNSFRAGLSIVARPNIRPNYASIDSWFMPLLLEESVIPEKPEDLAAEVSKYF